MTRPPAAPNPTLILALSSLALAALGPASNAARAERFGGPRPNVVVIVADDMGYADAGFQGCKDIPTPNIDALARSGVRCTNGYVSGPYCSPTRAGLLTGRYQQRFGHEFNPGGEAGAGKFGLPTAEKTMADRLKAEGYRTGVVGKWHLGGLPKFHPMKRGFDEFYGFLGGAHTYFAGKAQNIYHNETAGPEPTYLTDAIGREAVAFIDRNQDRRERPAVDDGRFALGYKPFFLEVTFNAVHTPMEATDDRLERFKHIPDRTRRTYAAMLSAMDDAVGAITAKLRADNLEEKTLIFFISDNGGPTLKGTTINGSSNAPFRGSKRTTLDGGIHVPFVVSWKGHVPAGKVYDQPVIQLDILPTALAAANIPVQPDWKLDGVDLLPFLCADKPGGAPHDALYWRFGQQDAIRMGDWKLVRYDRTVDTGERSKGDDVTPTARKLYNLADDPGESRDLAKENPEKAEELLKAWKAWDAQLVAPLWGADGADH